MCREVDTGEDMSGESARDLVSRRALRSMPTGWRALHEVRSTRRHLTALEHVVVGPAGVCVVVVRALSESLGAALTRVADAAIALAELIPMDTHDVVPVLCVQTD